MKKINDAKAKVLYDYLDSQDFYTNPVEKPYRSRMNVTFTSPTAELDKAFCAAAAEEGLLNLKGHRLVGGMRASIYNAMPPAGIDALVAFMEKFRKANRVKGACHVYNQNHERHFAGWFWPNCRPPSLRLTTTPPRRRAFLCAAPICTKHRCPTAFLQSPAPGAGTNNIPLDKCTEAGIVVFNTPGANANAVAELVVGALVAGSRHMPDAIQWAAGLKGSATLARDVEKGKKQFVGPELRGKSLGVIGPGGHWVPGVANAAVALGMEVLGYDPYISIDAAWSLSRSVQHCVALSDMLPRCDYLTVHVPYMPSTKYTINAQTLSMCKDGVRVLNFARGELVDNAAMLDALGSGKAAGYFCDFPAEELLGMPGVYCTPHLGASTPESETNCAVMAATELSDYLRNGNITHSVNLPDVQQPRLGGRRVCIIHKNAPGVISSITGVLTAANLNIENMVNKSRKDVAYTMLDVTGTVCPTLADELSHIEEAIRVRVL